jgi:hypothetical protein
MDVSGDGRVSFKEFATVLLHPPLAARPAAAPHVPAEDDSDPPAGFHSLDSMILAADADRDGLVSWEEFRCSPFGLSLTHQEAALAFGNGGGKEGAGAVTLKQVPAQR